MEATNLNKPKTIKAIRFMILFKLILAGIFYAVFALKHSDFASFILYTWIGYILMAGPIIYFLQKKNMTMLRIALAVDFIISIPSKAFIGLVISMVSLILTFSKSSRSYFKQVELSA